MTPDNFQRWVWAAGGRRFLLTLGAGIASTVLVWFHRITSSDYVLLISATVGAFIAGASWKKGERDKETPQ